MKFLSLFFLCLVGCTIYESGGHEAIEKNSGDIVSYSGLSTNLHLFYSCSLSAQAPEFLKLPLDVLDNSEPGYSSYVSTTAPYFVALYSFHDQKKVHSSCKVSYLSSPQALSDSDIQEGLHLAQSQILAVLPGHTSR